MLHVIDFAHLANDVYYGSTTEISGSKDYYRSAAPSPVYKFLQSWVGFPQYGDTEGNWSKLKGIFGNAWGFYARLYGNQLTRETVVAYRGTVLNQVGTLQADVELGINDWSAQDKAAVAFYTWACDYANENKYKPPAYVTGHSLGGFLAQIIAILNPKIKAIVFNSPGIGGVFCDPNGFHIPGLNGPVDPKDPSYPQRIFHYDLDTDTIHRIGVLIGSEHKFRSPDMVCSIAKSIAKYPEIFVGSNPTLNMLYGGAVTIDAGCSVSTEHYIDTLTSVIAKDPQALVSP